MHGRFPILGGARPDCPPKSTPTIRLLQCGTNSNNSRTSLTWYES